MEFKLFITDTKGISQKFLVLEDGTVIVGLTEYHQSLWAAYCTAHNLDPAIARPKLIGAGTCFDDGRVYAWHSSYFRFSTPYELQGPIEAFLQEQVAQLPVDVY